MATPTPNITTHDDGTLTWTHAHGSVHYRKAPSGVHYHARTAPEVVKILEMARVSSLKVRLFYGDPETGKDWLEEHDVEGRLGNSMGPLKVPLLVAPGQIGGAPLLDQCIVRIQVRGMEAWRHPNYHTGLLSLGPTGVPSEPYGVLVDGAIRTRFKSETVRSKYIDFIHGVKPSKCRSAGLAR